MKLYQPNNGDSVPDGELVSRSIRGDHGAFTELTRRYYRPVGSYILKRVQRPGLVEDLVQETFLEAFKTLKTGRPPEHFAGWLFGIALNVCGRWLRRKRPVLFDPTDPPSEPAEESATELIAEAEEQQALWRRLQAGIAELPADTRTLLEMKHRDGKTCEEIAGVMGRPVGTIKSLLSRTYKALRERVSNQGMRDEG